MRKHDRDEAKRLAALADQHLAAGVTPTICPPADAIRGTTLTLDAETIDRADAGGCHRAAGFRAPPDRRAKAARPAPRAPLFALGALLAIGAVLLLRAVRGARH